MSGVVLGVSVWALVDDTPFDSLLDLADDDVKISIATTAPLILICCSAVLMVVTFLGCCGAIKEKKLYLIIYLGLICLFFFLLVSGAVVAGVQDVPDALRDPLLNTVEKYNPSNPQVVEAWDEVMDEFDCCGVDSYQDWAEYDPYYATGLVKVPAACCEGTLVGLVNQVDCQQNPGDYATEIGPGCVGKMEEYLEDNEWIILGITIATLAVIVS